MKLNIISDCDALTNLLNGSLGTGILAMPLAFANGGLWFGLIATILVAIICTYCVHILVKCAHILCHRTEVPSFSYSSLVETAFATGPKSLQKYSACARFTINTLLAISLLGCCCIYNVFIAKNIEQVIEFYTGVEIDIRIFMLMLAVPMVLINLIRNLRHLAPFSICANALMCIGMAITLYYISQDLPPVSQRPAFASYEKLPMFFGISIFALEGIGVVLSLENDMKNPTHFIRCPGVLHIGMGFVTVLYSVVGFLGYLKYGDQVNGSITLNLPTDQL